MFSTSAGAPEDQAAALSISGSFSLKPAFHPALLCGMVQAMGNGMILDSPTIFGMSGNTLLGGGEAGAEAIVGVDSLRGMIRDAVAGRTSAIVALSGFGGDGDITIGISWARCLTRRLSQLSSEWRSGREADDGFFTLFEY